MPLETAFLAFINIVLLLSSLFLFYKRGFYRSAFAIWFFGYWVGVAGPFIYAAFGGVDYRVYGESALYVYGFIVTIYSVFFLFLAVLYPRDRVLVGIDGSAKVVRKARVVLYVIFCILLLYLAAFWDRLPLVLMLKGREFVRPDVFESELSYFFLFYSLVMVFLPLLAASYYKVSMMRYFLSLFCVLLFMLIGGNKGLAFFYVLFLFLYYSEGYKSVLMLAMGGILFFYVAFMIGTSGWGLDSLGYIIESPLKRLFVVQGIGVPARIEMLLDPQLGSALRDGDVARIVYRFVYGGEGAMPTFFVGDLLVHLGFLGGMFTSLIVLVVFYRFSILVDRSGGDISLWLYFLLSYSMIVSGFNYEFFLRFFLIFVAWFGLAAFYKLRLN